MVALSLVLSACWHDSTPAPVVTADPSIVSHHTFHHQRQMSSRQRFYRVAQGDTLYSIAWNHNIDYRQLARINHIAAPYAIYRGQLLKIKSDNPVLFHHNVAQKKAPVIRLSRNKQYLSQKSDHRNDTPQRKIVYNQKVTPVAHWIWPTVGTIIQAYSATNKGIDIAGRLNQAVKTTASGIVVYAGSGLPSYGNLLIIKHNSQYLTAYAHNNKLLVKEGQTVKAGQTIALMGKTGTSRIMLHFEIRRNGKPVNPVQYLARH